MPVLSYDCIIFDLDGTLLDTRQALLLALGDVLGQVGLGGAPDEVLAHHLHGGLRAMLAGSLRTLADSQQISAIDLTALEQQLDLHYREQARTSVTMFAGAERILDWLSREGVWLGVCSNQRHSTVVGLLQQMGLAHYFKCIVGADSFPARKPDPMPLTWLMGRANATPGRTLMVGDSEVDAEAALRAACACVVLSHGYGDNSSAHKGAWRLADFNALESFLTTATPTLVLP